MVSNRRLFARRGSLALAVMCVLGSAIPAYAQKITLRVRPPVGDTLYMRMDQHVEMYGDPVGGTVQNPMTASLELCTRSIVTHQTETTTDLISITDHVDLQPVLASMVPFFREMKRSLDQQRAVRLRMATDGSVEMLGAEDGEVNGTVPLGALTPAILPDKPVAVGATWTRDLQMPVAPSKKGGGHAKLAGTVRATFRFDSLSSDRMLAYISMRGSFSHVQLRGPGTVLNDSTAGTMSGVLTIDRRRAWITDSRLSMILFLQMQRPPSQNAADTVPSNQPVRLHMKITQRLRAMPTGVKGGSRHTGKP